MPAVRVKELLRSNALVLVGAVLGGLLGYFGFFWLVRQGLYGMVLPGGLVGLGAGLFRGTSKAVAVPCGILALALSLYTQWRFAAFVKDDSFGYFIAHLHHLAPMTLIMMTAGTLIGFWVPLRRSGGK